MSSFVSLLLSLPGVLSPYIKNDEDGMKLSLAGKYLQIKN